MANVTSTTGISSTLGSYSGITSQDIDKLIEAESLPIVKLNNQKSKITEQQNAWKDIKLRLSTMLAKVENLQKPEAFNTKKISNSNDKSVVFTADAKAMNENYTLTVDQLATSSRMTSGKIAELEGKTVYEKLGVAGELTFEGTKGKATIKVDNSDSLKEITNKINETSKDTGVKAAIIDNRLVISSVETGQKEIKIEATALAGTLGLTEETGGKFDEGKKAQFTIDGMEVERDSNTITDVIENVKIQLKAPSKDLIHIEMTQDVDHAVKSAKEFVEQYNNVMDFVNEKLDVGDPSKKDNKAGALVGDSSLIRLQTQLREMMTDNVDSGGKSGIKNPSELGISSKKESRSTIVFDEDKFRKAFEKNPEDVQAFFHQAIETKETVVNKAGESEIEKVTTNFGYTKGIKELMNSFVTDDKGKKSVYTTKSDSFSASVKNIESRIEKFTAQIDKKRDYYVRTFTRLDNVMMKAEEQMAYLQSQMAAFMPQ